MKGAILGVNPIVRIVDLTHEIPPQNIHSAGFTLFAAHQTFPPETIHLAVVDPGVGSARRAVIASTENHVFVAPDNGILSLVYEHAKLLQVFEITSGKFFRHPVSATFHGRDVFAPVAGALSLGVLPSEFGAEVFDFVRFNLRRPQPIDKNTIVAEILHIDHFGNCVTNITRRDLPQKFLKKGFRVQINKHEITKQFDFYSQADEKEIFTIFGSADFLEIVAFKASAADLLQVDIGHPLELKITA